MNLLPAVEPGTSTSFLGFFEGPESNTQVAKLSVALNIQELNWDGFDLSVLVEGSSSREGTRTNAWHIMVVAHMHTEEGLADGDDWILDCLLILHMLCWGQVWDYGTSSFGTAVANRPIHLYITDSAVWKCKYYWFSKSNLTIPASSGKDLYGGNALVFQTPSGGKVASAGST